jgi:hypothetical protein
MENIAKAKEKENNPFSEDVLRNSLIQHCFYVDLVLHVRSGHCTAREEQ